MPTDRFSIEGEVKQPLTIGIRDLDTFKARSLPDVDITNHLGEKKATLTGLKGVSLKDILGRVQLNAESPKVLSVFYFVFVASDKYTIVFSWNEIFNSETGNNMYVIIEEGGMSIQNLNDRISMVTLTDFKTGRRHLNNLSKILVERVKP